MPPSGVIFTLKQLYNKKRKVAEGKLPREGRKNFHREKIISPAKNNGEKIPEPAQKNCPPPNEK